MNQNLKTAVYGFAIGDALGVPFEFKQRGHFVAEDMIGHGSHNQPAGTWSDDTSLVLATCESIKRCREINCDDIMNNFKKWYYDGDFSATGSKFDVGCTVSRAIEKFSRGEYFVEKSMYSNGNGGLMRILPLSFINCSDGDIDAVCSLTHGHLISLLSCKYYHRIILGLAQGKDLINLIRKTSQTITNESPFDRIPNVYSLCEKQIKSTPYVVDTLEAAIWCVAHTNNYKDCVLKAVNLGGDTDTMAALSGAMAALIYGYDSIPPEWIVELKNKELIESCLF